MPGKTSFISYRIASETQAELKRQAKAAGLTPNAFAAEALLEKLERAKGERRASVELFEEVRRLRADLSLATEAVLTLTGKGANAREMAGAWVRKNLNH